MTAKLFTFQETCDELRVKKNTLIRIIKNQEISFIVMGHKKYMFTQEAIDEYLVSRTVRAKPFVPVANTPAPVLECPLCGKPSPNGEPHTECADREQTIADKQGAATPSLYHPSPPMAQIESEQK